MLFIIVNAGSEVLGEHQQLSAGFQPLRSRLCYPFGLFQKSGGYTWKLSHVQVMVSPLLLRLRVFSLAGSSQFRSKSNYALALSICGLPEP